MPKNAIMQLTPGSYAAPTMLASRLAEPDFQEDFALLGEKLRARLDADNEVFAPKASDNRPVVDDWLQQYEAQFLTILPELFFEQYPGLRNQYKAKVADLARLLLNNVREDLRRYALRRLAIRWSASRYPDAAGIGEPEKLGDDYLVPIVALRDNRRIGCITLTPSGTVLPNTSTGQELREALVRAA